MKKMRPKKLETLERKHRKSLTLIFSLIVFSIICGAMVVGIGFTYLFVRLGWIGDLSSDINIRIVFLFIAGFSLAVGALASFAISRIPLKPINVLINKLNRLAAGDFKTRLKFTGVLESNPTFVEISNSFNTLAEELECTEMLRADFVNNLSHEFKTPIVSIAGLAKLVNRGNITEEQRAQYLGAIEEESLRLATMATNVLNLTKIENQTILSSVTKYNLSEQIRSCVLLLENKWTKKRIELCVDFDEYYVSANEEMLKQVWINLLDNAIKFSSDGETVSVTVSADAKATRVAVTNRGSDIPLEARKRIFSKFYQADESHAAEGNGIGLAIVKHIVDLHGGSIGVECADGLITFEVVLSNN